eukprot:7382787-Prymnesium_polylepis.1
MPELGESEEMQVLPDGAEAGGVLTAIEVWSTAIKYLDALHAPVANDWPGTPERKAYAAEVGKRAIEWAEAMQHHAANTANWQFAHKGEQRCSRAPRPHASATRRSRAQQ